LYTDQHVCGTSIRGVYPRHCPLEETAPAAHYPFELPYLDILQFWNSHGHLVVRTLVHDRRRGEAFRGLCLAGFPHASCTLAATSLVHMVRAGMQRRMRIVNHHAGLVTELSQFGRDLFHAGYPYEVLGAWIG
jgi:hypothetical protein